MGMWGIILSLVLLLYPCKGVIYKLNEETKSLNLPARNITKNSGTEYARMPPLYVLDEYDTCLKRDRGLYCLVQLNLFDDGENPLMDLIHEYSDHTIRHYNHTIIDRGVCMQDTCGSYIKGSLTGEALTRALGACLNESIWKEYGLQANVSLLYYCDSNGETNDITTQDWTVMAVFIIIIMVNLFASYYDYAANNFSETDNVVGNRYILCFSMIRNFKWLTSFKPEDPRIQVLQFIHFVRVLINFLMIMAHTMLPAATGYTSNTHDLEKSYDLVFYQLVFNGMMIVQIFFFISGFLLAYNLQIQAQKNKVTWYDVPKVMFLRCCRLSPALAVVLAFSATWLRHLGSGPLWKLFITNSVVADCRTYWWHHLLYINNYIQSDKYCVIPTWHIAADSQAYLIGLIVCVATIYRGRYLVSVVLLLACTALPAFQVWLQDLDGVVLMKPEFYRTLDSETFRNAHIVGHNNLQCFLVGMVVAYLVYDWQDKGVNISQNKYFSAVFWSTPPAIALWFYTGHVFYADGDRASLLVRMVYAATHRLVMAAITAIFTIGMVLRAPSYFRSLAEWRMWTVPSRFSYSVYLLHMNLVHIFMAIKRQPEPFSFYSLATDHLRIVLLTYLIAVPFFLLVEAPSNRFVKVLLNPQKPTDLIVEKKIKKAS